MVGPLVADQWQLLSSDKLNNVGGHKINVTLVNNKLKIIECLKVTLAFPLKEITIFFPLVVPPSAALHSSFLRPFHHPLMTLICKRVYTNTNT